MAARRLLIVMLLLLGVSTLAAALVPPPERQQDETESSTATARQGTTEPRLGERVAAQVTAERGRPEFVRVSTGDQLVLVVQTARAAEVAVPDFGLIEFAEPDAPARFDLLVERTGRFEVTAERAGTVATIVAERPRRQP